MTTKQAWVAKKIRTLRREGYPEKQAIAIAYRMAGIARPKASRDHSGHHSTHRFTSAERSGRAASFAKLARKGGSHVYAEPEVKRTASYKRAERLEEELAPKRWNTPGLSRSQYEKLADAWERAGFFGWADNYRAHVESHRIGRDVKRKGGTSKRRRARPVRRLVKKIVKRRLKRRVKKRVRSWRR